MSRAYSQLQAFKAITIAALRSISKSPSSVIFTIAFPLIFILVFGFIGGGSQTIKVALSTMSDTSSIWLQQLRDQTELRWVAYRNEADLEAKLQKGEIDVWLDVSAPQSTPAPTRIRIVAGPLSQSKAAALKQQIQNLGLQSDSLMRRRLASVVTVQEEILQQRPFKTIDFILPGQLGFSLLAASIFGTAFVFFNLRQNLVLKRFFATPVRREYILLAEGTARMIFQLLGAVCILFIGWAFLDYTLINGWVTVVNLLLLCALGVLVFMSFGFIISGIAKSESTIPPLANILTLPQFLLAGTFFSVSVFPKWLQPFSKILPLTYLNDALRAVAFDGASLWGVKWQIAVLLLWGVIGYALAARLFRWE